MSLCLMHTNLGLVCVPGSACGHKIAACALLAWFIYHIQWMALNGNSLWTLQSAPCTDFDCLHFHQAGIACVWFLVHSMWWCGLKASGVCKMPRLGWLNLLREGFCPSQVRSHQQSCLPPWGPAREGPGAAGTSPKEAPRCSEGWSNSAVGIGLVQEERKLQGHLIAPSSTQREAAGRIERDFGQ